MNRLYLRLSSIPFIAFLLLVGLSATASAQGVSYVITGQLQWVPTSGPDKLGFSGLAVTATATLDPSSAPSSFQQTTTSSSNTYTGGSVGLAGFSCPSSTEVVLTDNVGAPDTISVPNCTVTIFGISATITASVTIPDGAMTSAVPANIPQTSITGTVSVLAPVLTGSNTPTVFNLVTGSAAIASVMATGGAAPTVVPSLSSWSPSAQQGATAAMTQQVTFTTNPSASYDAVSFTATAASTGNWLSVTPGELNTTSPLTITANPSGLTAGTYNGTVTLSAPNQSGTGMVTIQVTLTVTAPPATLSASTLAPFNWAIGTAAPLSQPLTISSSPSSVNITNVTSNSSWLQVSPTTGATPANFTVSVNTTGITTAQNLTGQITVTAPNASNSPLQIPVTFNVAASSLNVSPSLGLTFNYTIDGNQPLSQPLSINGTSGINYSVSSAVLSPVGGNWLTATPTGTTVPGSVNVSVITTGLAAGTYSGTVTVTSAGAAGSPAVIPITFVVSAPTLAPNPTSLTFNYQLGATAPNAQPFAVTSVPSGISFSAAAAVVSPAGGNWLQATVTNGTTPGSVSVSIINTANLPAATASYTGTVTISSNGATSQVVNVTLNVTQPAITATPGSINFAYQIGTTAPSAQPISVGGTSGLAISASVSTTPPGGSWLSATVTNGTTPGSVSVSVNTNNLTAATYNGTVTLSAPGAPSVSVPVSLVVSSQPTISLTPSQLSFAYQISGAAPSSQPVNIGGTSSLPFTATVASTTGGAWLVLTNGSGNTPGSFNVGVNTSVLKTAGNYSGTITVAATGAQSQTLNVSIVVSNLPTITASPSNVSFAYQIGGAAPSSQPISVNASSSLSYSVSMTGGAWLSVTSGSGSTPGTVTVSVNTSGLTTAQTLNGAITISSSGASNSPVTIPVTLTVSPAPNKLTLSPTSIMNFAATVSGTPPSAQTLNVTSTNAGTPISVATNGGSWLIATVQTAVTPAVVNVYANPVNLSAGTYFGVVVVTSSGSANSPQSIGVQFVVSPANNLSAAPTDLSFNYTVGGTVPANQSIAINSTQPLSISTSAAGASWLTATASSSSTPASVTVSVNPASLPVGTYQAAISITSTGAVNSPEVIPVSLVVSNKPMLAPSPSILTFTTQTGAANPASQSVNLTAGAAVPFSIATSPSWLSVSASASTTPATLVVTVNSKGMTQGSYQGAITLTSSTAGNSPVTIPVALDITAPLVITGPSISSIVNGASYDATGFAPGAIVTIFGSSLGPQTPAAGTSFSVRANGIIDSTLAGASVTVDGVPAIPLFVSSGQINIILPFNLATSGQSNVEVQYNNQTSTDFNIALVPADVQMFTSGANGSGPGAILNQDNSVNTQSNPATPGSVIQIYATGAGLVSPSVTAGDVAGDALSTVSLPFSATVAGENATVEYAGTAPGLVYGVYQFNVQLPASLPAGAQNIVLTVGSSTSQPDVTVWVK
jgi:uncharacterized protein (TIGR03437 family)